jgi:hypothetical protein
MSGAMKKRHKSPHPAPGVHRRDGAVATDTVCSDTPTVGGGETAAQVFVGTESAICDVCGTKSDKQFANALGGNVVERSAPAKLISDRAQADEAVHHVRSQSSAASSAEARSKAFDCVSRIQSRVQFQS